MKFQRKIHHVHSRGGWRFGIYFRGYFQSTLSFNEISGKLCVTRIVVVVVERPCLGQFCTPSFIFRISNILAAKKKKDKIKQKKKIHCHSHQRHSKSFLDRHVTFIILNKHSIYFITLKKHFVWPFYISSYLWNTFPVWYKIYYNITGPIFFSPWFFFVFICVYRSVSW